MRPARGPSGGRIKTNRSFTGYLTTSSFPSQARDDERSQDGERSQDYVSGPVSQAAKKLGLKSATRHSQGGDIVAQVVQADIAQPCTAPDAVPRIEQSHMAGGEYIRGLRITRHRLEQRQSGGVEGDNP